MRHALMAALFFLLLSAIAHSANVRIIEGVVVESGLEYAVRDGKTLLLDVYCPEKRDGPLAAVLCLHGGGLVSGQRVAARRFALPLARNGFVAVAIEYRSTRFPAPIHDAKEAVRWMRANAGRLNIDPERIGVCGEALGGYVAQFLGLTCGVKKYDGEGACLEHCSRVACVASFSAPADLIAWYRGSLDSKEWLSEFIGGDPKQAAQRYLDASTIDLVTSAAAPTLCIHGDKDTKIPYAQSVRLVDRLKAVGADATLYTGQGIGHSFKGVREAEEVMIAFFAARLKKS